MFIGAYYFFWLDGVTCVYIYLITTFWIGGFLLSGVENKNIDRDSTRWKLAAKVVEKRRRVFWEVFAQDKWSVSIIPCFFYNNFICG